MERLFTKMKSLKAFSSNPIKTYKNLPGIENKITGTKFEAPVDAFSSQAFGMNSASWYGTVFDGTGRVFTLDRIPYKFLQNADNFFKKLLIKVKYMHLVLEKL